MSLKLSTVTVVGQGYVGLPLAVAAAEFGHKVTGIEIDSLRLSHLQAGRSDIADVADERIENLISKGNLAFEGDYDSVSSSEIVIVCVPTPLDDSGIPNLDALISASQSVAKNIPDGSTFISESTSYPGTLRTVIAPIFESQGKSQVQLAVAPERIDPGNSKWNLKNTPRVVGALTSNGLKSCHLFYETICDSVISVESPEIAELSKLAENTFRQVNIALVNELAQVSHSLKIDFAAVLDAAATKPFGFAKFMPGIGIGGHCIPIDPIYLLWKAKVEGLEAKMIDLAASINSNQPLHVVRRISEVLPGNEMKICIMGMGYKFASCDLRESPSLVLLDHLREIYKDVKWYDPYVEKFKDECSVDELNVFDLVVVVHPYPSEIKELRENGREIFDCSGTLRFLPLSHRLY